MKNDYRICLGKPARYWDDGLPIGNGRLGAMVMGKTDEETIFINEESVWYGSDRDRKNPDTLKYLDEIRSLLMEGEVQKAQFLAKMAMTSAPKYMNPYQPAGDMRICFLDHKHPVTEYKRTLDLNDALCHVQYRMRDVLYTREHLASHAYQVIAVKLTADGGKLTFSVNMSRKPFEENTEKLDEHTVCNYGRLGENGIRYFTGIRLASKGGSVHTIGDFVCVEDAQEAYIYLACGTDFQDPAYREHCLERLDAAQKAGYEEIRRKHLEEYHALFGRMELHFGEEQCGLGQEGLCGDGSRAVSPYADRNMNELLAEAAQAEEAAKAAAESDVTACQEDTDAERLTVYLAEMLFHYARYLMISSSYDCVLPANLQGIWNGEYVPPWQSEFTININTEMNYWMVEKCNLSECHLPLFDLIKRMVPKGQETAKRLYDCEGFCAHHNTNIWANTDPEGIFDASPIWPMGGAWLALHLYEHYAYTGDVEFLKKEALPVMGEAIRFFEKYLTPTEDGYLITGPTISPENTYISKLGGKGALCMGASMDSQILRQLFTAYLEGCEVLQAGMEAAGTAEDLRVNTIGAAEVLPPACEKVRQMLDKLPPIDLTSDGRIREWLEDYEETEPGHRHISHLFALHPGSQITEEQPKYFAAARKTLEHRLAHGGGHTGWSCAWIACFWTRLKDQEQAWASVKKMLKSCIKINLLDTHPPFQIDGNFGIADCIAEMLLQDHAGYVEFLPALPEAVAKAGYVKGMVIRGGILADFAWREGKLCELELTVKKDKAPKGNTLKGNAPLEITVHINGSRRRILLQEGVNKIQCEREKCF